MKVCEGRMGTPEDPSCGLKRKIWKVVGNSVQDKGSTQQGDIKANKH